VCTRIDETAEATPAVSQTAFVVMDGDDVDHGPEEEDRDEDEERDDERPDQRFHWLRPLRTGAPGRSLLVAAGHGPAAEARSLHGRRSACVQADPATTSVQESNLRLPRGAPDRRTVGGDAAETLHDVPPRRS
jgi:hypothetical protein